MIKAAAPSRERGHQPEIDQGPEDRDRHAENHRPTRREHFLAGSAATTGDSAIKAPERQIEIDRESREDEEQEDQTGQSPPEPGRGLPAVPSWRGGFGFEAHEAPGMAGDDRRQVAHDQQGRACRSTICVCGGPDRQSVRFPEPPP